MSALGAARYIERAGALALALGVAIAMSAEPPVAHASRGSAPRSPPPASERCPRSRPDAERRAIPRRCRDGSSASGGWVGVVSAILVALGRRPSASASSRSPSGRPLMELVAVGVPARRADRSSATTAPPVSTRTSDDGTRASRRCTRSRGLARCATSQSRRMAGTRTSRPRIGPAAPTRGRSRWSTPKPTRWSRPSKISRMSSRRALRPVPIRRGSTSQIAMPPPSASSTSARAARPATGSWIRFAWRDRRPSATAHPAAIALSPNGSRLYALMTGSGSNPAVLILDPDARVSGRNRCRR